MGALNLIAHLRQKTFPRAFRIKVQDVDTMPDVLADSLREIRQFAEQLKHSTARKNVTSKPAIDRHDQEPEIADNQESPQLDRQFVIGVCNECFRLSYTIESLGKELNKDDCRDLKKLRNSLTRVDNYCKKKGFEWHDVTGEDYSLSRSDFDPIDQVEDPKLTKMKITRCEKPVVRLNNKIIQKARGIVGRPPRRPS